MTIFIYFVDFKFSNMVLVCDKFFMFFEILIQIYTFVIFKSFREIFCKMFIDCRKPKYLSIIQHFLTVTSSENIILLSIVLKGYCISIVKHLKLVIMVTKKYEVVTKKMTGVISKFCV